MKRYALLGFLAAIIMLAVVAHGGGVSAQSAAPHNADWSVKD